MTDIGKKVKKIMKEREGNTEEREFKIWCEGYVVTGQSGKAQLLGTGRGRTFKEACQDYFRERPKEERRDYDAQDNTYWACKLYDNAADARRSFG